MLTRLLPAVFTALGLVATYWVYALAVVPLVEPNHSRPTEDIRSSNQDDRTPIGGTYADLLATYFPSGHWARARPPKVLENRQVMLIFADFEENENGRVRLEPAAMIFFPNPRESAESLPNDAIIMEAPNGAVFQFEGGFRPGQGQIGKFDWGVLQGDVTIRSNMQDDGPNDDLVVKVSDVQINERRVWSNNDVAFRLGSNYGTGTKLEIRFLPAAEAEGSRQQGLDIGGVLSVEITKNVDVTMHVAERAFSNDQTAPATSPATAGKLGRGGFFPGGSSRPTASDAPVHITCDGSFIFHFERQFAQFDKNVRVTRAYPIGPPDLLTCQMLDVFFEQRKEEMGAAVGSSSDAPSAVGRANRRAAQQARNGARKKSFAGAQSIDLRPTRLVAYGAPVRVDAPSAGARARCERLTYELDDARIILETITPGHDVTMRWESPERLVKIESPAISYEIDPATPRARIGILRSAGPGWLRATDGKGSDDSAFTAEWTDRVDLHRDNGQPVLSLYGSPKVAFGGLGHTSGNELHLWLKEPPAFPDVPTATQTTPAKKEPRRPFVLPDRMRVLGNVRIDSPQLVANLIELRVWFRHVEGHGVDRSESPNANEPTTNHRLKDLLRGNRNERDPMYKMDARLLQLELALSGMAKAGGRATAEVKHVWITGGLVLQQRPVESGAAVPLDIRGDRLHVENADAPGAIVELFGKADSSGPEALASISAQGATLRGRTMHLDRAANRMSVLSAGNLTMPLDRQLDGRPLAKPQRVTVAWQDRLDFDGKKAVFSGGVRAGGAGGWMQAEKLTATMHRMIDFRVGTSTRIDIDRIRCEGNVIVDRREQDASGLVGQEHFEVPSLSINRSTGDIDGRGPGWMRSVRYAGAASLWPTANRRQVRPAIVRGQSPTPSRRIPSTAYASTAGPPRSSTSRLRYLRIDFQNRMDGNLNRREMQVEGDVHAIYGPVDSWEQEIRIGGPAWKNGGMALTCDRLSATQMKGGPRRQDWAELEATGNVEVEGYTPQIGDFAAQAQRLTFDQQKDLLILDGGTSDARLWRENSAGTPSGTTVARKIKYARSRNHIAIEDVRSLDMSQFP